MTLTRCKVSCSAKIPSTEGVYLHFYPVYTGSKENEQFFKITPGGTIAFNIVNLETANKFEIGKEYYVDFTSTT